MSQSLIRHLPSASLNFASHGAKKGGRWKRQAFGVIEREFGDKRVVEVMIYT